MTSMAVDSMRLCRRAWRACVWLHVGRVCLCYRCTHMLASSLGVQAGGVRWVADSAVLVQRMAHVCESLCLQSHM